MNISFGPALRAFAPLALLLAQVAPAPAQTVEQPPSFNAAQIPFVKRVGENYSIRSPVQSDGILRVYVLTTPYGDITVQGDEMLRMRINELNALALLEKVSNSESFGKALAEAGLSPLKFAGSLIVNPVGTVQNTMAGVGGFFGRMGAGMNNMGQTQDHAMSDLLGVTDQRRELAATYGVDPYTDLPPLKEKLEQLSRAAATGGLMVTGAMMAIPGGAGIIVSNLSTANKVNNIGVEDLARKYTAAQILDLNRGLLTKMGVDDELTKKMLANRNYTPIDAAIMIGALDSMRGVQDRSVFVARAASADGRAIAYVMRRTAELMADDYRRHGGYVRFVSLAAFPYAITRDGRVTALLPIDALSWTRDTAVGFTQVTNERKRLAPNARGELRITGTATAMAKEKLKGQGWAILERQHF
jgi:hypothetical protein